MKATSQQIFARNVRLFRIQSCLTQAQLSEKIDVSPGYISMIETCKTNISFDLIDSLADVLHVEPQDFFVDSVGSGGVKYTDIVADNTENFTTVTKRMLSEFEYLIAKYKVVIRKTGNEK